MSSRSLNRATLIGNLTRDPELKYTPQGTAVCTFGVATNRNWVTATGELKEDVQYHRIVAWQKLAELCGKILAKGKKVYLEGRITYRSYIGKDGVQRTITEIILDDFVVLDARRPENAPSSSYVSSKQVGKTPYERPTEKPVEKSEEVSSEKLMDEKIEPEDIPF
ncbi:MAG TPA: single-stranded DNA-binding protein [Patescibacteria group bacterium]|nr:single-stranded DNA-binding protein [Patescibacteria group bacterium]